MARDLRISLGQHSERGRKESNQDFHGAMIPHQPLLGTKGIAVALADGISSSPVSRVAAESAVKGFLTDYYCTSDAWSVKTSAQRVIDATNSWLYGQSRRGPHAEDRDRGYVCTFSAMVVKSATAHLFHIGDSRIYRLSGDALEQLTEDHRVVVSSEEVYLGRALGVNARVEIDYRTVALEPGDVFIQATDGVCEHIAGPGVARALASHGDDLDRAARAIAEEAFAGGSADNLTVQVLRIDELPDGEAGEILGQAELPLPPLLEPRQPFDGYQIVRRLHESSRSHVYLAVDGDDGERVAIKIPSIDLRGDRAYLRQFLMEEWIARRIDSAHVLKGRPSARKRHFLYTVTEFIEGQTLAQWMVDNPSPGLEPVRRIVEQIALGLRAFHRLEMLHRDLRPENVLIDGTGTVKIIDFGSVQVAGIAETASGEETNPVPGAIQYTAPEDFLGEGGTPASDQFSLGVIAYQMLTGRLPYGAEMARARTRGQQRAARYASVLEGGRGGERELPAWIDGALRRAVHPDPHKRYDDLWDFVTDLRQPNAVYLRAARAPLIERNPLLFWKMLSLVLTLTVLALLAAIVMR
jgi:serine/threonine protein phosphatase PrpC